MLGAILATVIETCRKVEASRPSRVPRKKTIWFEVEASGRSDQSSEPSRVKVVDVDASRCRNVKSR